MNIPEQIKIGRANAGLTQQQLAELAGVSLSTLQKVEAGEVSPSIQTAASLLKQLGLRLSCDSEPVPWDKLAAIGVPITEGRKVRVEKNKTNLVQLLILAAAEVLSARELNSRKAIAVKATVFAIQLHYPKVFKERLKRATCIQELLKSGWNGETIKLYRLALAGIKDYL